MIAKKNELGGYLMPADAWQTILEWRKAGCPTIKKTIDFVRLRADYVWCDHIDCCGGLATWKIEYEFNGKQCTSYSCNRHLSEQYPTGRDFQCIWFPEFMKKAIILE